jgi:hypothetical protein
VKTVTIVGHTFDCLPGHLQITARGEGSSVRIAAQRAIKNLLKHDSIRRRRVNSFKLSVVITREVSK